MLARGGVARYCLALRLLLSGEASLTVRNRSLAALLSGVALCAAIVASPGQAAHAQSVPPDYKGIVGLGLIGGELGMVIPALAGIDETWAYLVFPAVGAIGGGVAGHFLLEANGHTEISIAALGVGMALVIPATVLTLSLNSYDPADEMPPAAPESARFDVNAARARRIEARVRAGSGLVRMADGGVWLGAPAVGPVASVTAAGSSTVRFGVSDFQLSLLSGAF